MTLLATSDFDPPDFDLNAADTIQTVVPVNGTATFSQVTALADTNFGGTATVDLTFSTTRVSDCVIDIQFVEPNND